MQPPTAVEAIRAANLDWGLAKAPLFYHRSLTETAVLPDTYAVVTDGGWPRKERPVLGIVSGLDPLLLDTADTFEALENQVVVSCRERILSENVARRGRCPNARRSRR